MDFQKLTAQLDESAGMIRSLAENVSLDQGRWKPNRDSWSILEVVNHLADEEELDFRIRLEITLYRIGETWTPNDPEAWVTEREYNARDLAESLNRFLIARQESLTWLREIEAPDWDRAYQAPWGKITAGDIFASWVAHDLLHARQLVELHWLHTNRAVTPYSTDYAGQW